MGAIPDPDAPGRGPARLLRTYEVVTDQDETFRGQFVGVVFGTSKRADTLIFKTGTTTYRGIRYGELVTTIRIESCPECHRRAMRRIEMGEWECDHCNATLTHDPAPIPKKHRPPPRDVIRAQEAQRFG